MASMEELIGIINTLRTEVERLQQQVVQQQVVQQQVFTQFSAPPQQPEVHPVKIRHKLPNPSKFDGSRHKLREFVCACTLVIEANPEFYADGVNKIAFVASLLEGSALTWLVPYK